MILPSGIGGDRTSEVGFFHATPERLAEHRRAGQWLTCAITRPGWTCLEDMTDEFDDYRNGNRRAWVPIGDGWSVLFSNSATGTTVDGWHEDPADDIGVLGLRAVCSEDPDNPHRARILEIAAPTPDAGVRERYIAAVSEDGRWSFETSGEPFDFEDLDAYARRRKPDRFTADMLYRYLAALGVPYDSEPDWPGAVVITHHPASWWLTGRRRRL